LKFIEKRSAAVEMKDQLHAIWYFSIGFIIFVDDHAFIGTVYPWTAHALCYPQNLGSSIREWGKASSITYLIMIMC
jgi:hypothetical protein